MKRIEGVGVVLALMLGLALQASAASAVTREPLDVYVVACVQDAGEVWYTGGGKILHVRGQINREYLYETTDLELVGDLISVISLDWNLASGSGGVNASFSAYLHEISMTDPFLGTVAGKIKNFRVDARVVAHGTGEARGVRRKARLVPVDLADVPGELLLKLPCFPDGGIYLATGTLEGSR